MADARRAICGLYRRFGYELLLVTVSVESEGDLRGVLGAIGAEEHVVVRLEAEPETLRRRITQREPDTFTELDELVAASAHLSPVIAGLAGSRSRSTEGERPAVVAERIRAAWQRCCAPSGREPLSVRGSTARPAWRNTALGAAGRRPTWAGRSVTRASRPSRRVGALGRRAGLPDPARQARRGLSEGITFDSAWRLRDGRGHGVRGARAARQLEAVVRSGPGRVRRRMPAYVRQARPALRQCSHDGLAGPTPLQPSAEPGGDWPGNAPSACRPWVRCPWN